MPSLVTLTQKHCPFPSRTILFVVAAFVCLFSSTGGRTPRAWSSLTKVLPASHAYNWPQEASNCAFPLGITRWQQRTPGQVKPWTQQQQLPWTVLYKHELHVSSPETSFVAELNIINLSNAPPPYPTVFLIPLVQRLTMCHECLAPLAHSESVHQLTCHCIFYFFVIPVTDLRAVGFTAHHSPLARHQLQNMIGSQSFSITRTSINGICLSASGAPKQV